MRAENIVLEQLLSLPSSNLCLNEEKEEVERNYTTNRQSLPDRSTDSTVLPFKLQHEPYPWSGCRRALAPPFTLLTHLAHYLLLPQKVELDNNWYQRFQRAESSLEGGETITFQKVAQA